MSQKTKPLAVIDGKSLLALEVDPPKFIISSLMPVGLHILSGSAKIGKSWLSLWLCQQISNGLPVWEFETLKCGTLYLALEDTVDRLHFRLSHITDTGSEQSFFATESENLSGSLISQLEKFMQDYPATGLIVIDTLQRVRGSESDKSMYVNDYNEIGKIKDIADRYKIAILLVHHVRKAPDSDPFNTVSGSMGIIGAVDSMYVLEKERRAENKAVLHVTGRDVEDKQLLLEFDRERTVWNFISYLSDEQAEDKLVPAVVSFISKQKSYSGTSSALLEELKNIGAEMQYSPNVLTRKLKEQALILEKRHNIKLEFTRKKDARLISLVLVGDGDDRNTQVCSPELSSSDIEDDDVTNKGVHEKTSSPSSEAA
ncbi:MAG: helicase RepA family protein [Oscillospiraceae bacterium]|nr:helicase RepA family protein [Oscillospiraceae bacterium]